MRQKKTLEAEKPSMRVAGARFAFAMLALSLLCICAVAEDKESANYWYDKSVEQYNNGSLEESLQSVDKAIELDPENATLWAYKASSLNLAGVITQNQSRFDESIQAYDKAIELDPENTTYLLWKGYTFRQAAYGLQGEERTSAFNEAIATFDRALEIDPEYGEAWAGKGVIYDDLAMFNNDSARYSDSLTAYDKAIELTPANDTRNLAQAYEGKAVALSHMGQDLALIGQKEESRARLEEAVENYDKVIDLDPGFVGQEAQQNRAGVLDELGRHDEAAAGYEKAIEHLNRSIEENLNNSGEWAIKATLFREQGRYEAAIAALNNATKIMPEYVMAWEMMGEILSSDLGRYEESIEAYDRALQLDPTNARAWTGKGHALRSLGRNREAVLAYDRALEIDPDRAAAWLGKGAALRNQERYNESVQAYDEALRAIEQDPRYSSAALAVADAWIGKAESLVGPDRIEEAAEAYNESLQAYEKAIQIDPESARTWMGKGNALLSLKRYNESMEAYERSVEILNGSQKDDPEDAEAWWLKAESLDSMGRSDEALQAYDRVIELNSSKAFGAWIRKSDIFISLGKYNESVEAFDGALNLLPTRDKQSIMSLWWARGIDIYHNAWIADGQILRTASAWRNQSTGAIENIMLVNSDFTAAWQRPTMGKAVSADGKPLGRHDEALQASSANWAQYGFPGPKEAAQENTAGYWIEKGDDLVENGSFEEALAEYDRALRIDPEYLDSWSRKAEVLYILEQQAYRNVLSLSERRLEKNPQDARAWQAHAVALASLGRQEEANESLEKALEIYDQEIQEDPENATAWFYKAELTANSTEALAAYERVIELNGSMKIESLLTKGNILVNLGRSDEALAAIDQAIQLNPNNSDAWKQKALNSYVLGRYNESLEAYERVIELVPASGWIWKGKGDALKALGRQAEAEEAYDKAREMGYVV